MAGEYGRMLVCESGSRWTVGLRWLLGAHAGAIQTLDSPEACLAAAARFPRSVLLLDLTVFGLTETVDFLVAFRQEAPSVAVIVAVRDRSSVPFVYELGADFAVDSLYQLAHARRLIHNRLPDESSLASEFRTQILSRMPWEPVAPRRTSS